MDNGALVQTYNGHISVDSEYQSIAAVGLSNQAPDTDRFAGNFSSHPTQEMRTEVASSPKAVAR